MRFRLATAEDQHLPYYSHSIVEAIETCPKWGLIRYKDRKYFRASYRALALEAGSAMHEVFSAFRLWQIFRIQNLPHHFKHHAVRLYGLDRYEACWKEKPNKRDEVMSFCFEILNSGEYYDDPGDKIRTMANMEVTTIRYTDEQLKVMDRNPIWIQDLNDPTALVGVEIPFDIVVDDAIRYIGTIDGIVDHIVDHERLDENKTASRLDEAWREAFRVKFQPTGYTVAGRLVTGKHITKTRIIGVKIKQTNSMEDYLSFMEERDDEHFISWYDNLWYTHYLTVGYEGRYLNAPMFTHSCNRYFRPCGFIDLCAGSIEDQQLMYDSMEVTPLTPSEAAIIEKWRK